MTTPVLLISAAPVFIIGVVFLLMPRVRAGILFGVSVPVEFAESENGQSITGRYRTGVLAIMVAALIAIGSATYYSRFLLGPFVIIVQMIGLSWMWVRAWRATQPFAVKPPLLRSASLSPNHPLDGFSLLQFAALLPVLCAALYLQLHWLQIPARFATHWGADNVPNGWATRSFAGVFGPVVIGGLLILGVVLLTWFVARVQPTQARQMRPILFVVSWMMSVMFTYIVLHPLSARPDAMPDLIFWILGGGMVALVAAISYVIHLAHGDVANAWDGTPDAGWRWGLVYYNPADSAILVRNRFGLGWTLNFASRQAKLWVGGMLLFAALIMILALYAAHPH